MTIFLMTVSMVAYVLLVVFCSRRALRQFNEKFSKEVAYYLANFKKLVEKKELLNHQKVDIKEELFKTFTLYEITKDITKKLHLEEAFEIFHKKLSENVIFKDCKLIPADAKDLEEFKSSNGWFVFNLQSEKKSLGSIAVLGINELDQNKFMILAHQFALAVRRIKLYEEVEQISITDGLTESFNRRYFMQRLKEEFDRSKLKKIKMSVLMLDVDFFKKINDEFGHLTGDQVLRQAAIVIKDNIREIDVAGRYGGEEFCVLLPDTDREGAKYAAERIRFAMEQKIIRAYDTNIAVTVSIGVSTYPKDATSASAMIECADQALYQAKKLGRNQVQLFADVNSS